MLEKVDHRYAVYLSVGEKRGEACLELPACYDRRMKNSDVVNVSLPSTAAHRHCIVVAYTSRKEGRMVFVDAQSRGWHYLADETMRDRVADLRQLGMGCDHIEMWYSAKRGAAGTVLSP